MNARLLIPLLLLLCLSCSRRSHTVTRGMYYWKTVFNPTDYERKRMTEAGCKDLYLRCFDVVKEGSGRVRPVGLLRNLPDSLNGMHFVPVVYITQEALNTTTGADLPELAANMARLLGSLWNGKTPPDEVQIDCDWTAGNRDRYFGLLRALRGQPFFRGKRLSCTIRLHQIRFQSRSGIPPVDRGLLMCYNMGSLKKPGAHNSILNPQLAEDYLQHLRDYPLALDVALPLFDWSLLFRDEKLRGIMRDVSPEMIAASPLFREAGTNLFTCLADSSFAGYELRRGDIVRTEISERKDILRIANFVAGRLRNDSLRVLLFHCDILPLAKHPYDELEAIYSAFD
jgi:hypothetical protein